MLENKVELCVREDGLPMKGGLVGLAVGNPDERMLVSKIAGGTIC